MSFNLAAIPLHLPFLDVLAQAWLDQAGDGDPLLAARGLILLPTRRAARALSEAFLRLSEGRVMLLPRIAAIGALDEAPLALGGLLDALPAVEPMQRLSLLSRMVLAAGNRFGTAPTLDQAWPLAQALAELMDEAERAECDLATALPGATTLPGAASEFAEHWQVTLEFLSIVTRTWPAWLAENGLANPVARQVGLLRAQARCWEDEPPAHPVWAAGFTAASPAVVALLRAVARLQRGQVVVPGLDCGTRQVLDDATWETLPASHPQAGLARLLADLGARRDDAQCWDDPRGVAVVPEARVRTLSRALLPEHALGDWMDRSEPVDTAGIARLAPADQQEEAAAVALVLREALEVPGRRAALVTPDRMLAGRVAVELARWGVSVDDSAGEPLAATPPAVFLRLLAEAVLEGLSPVPLLSLLKHPLAAAGLAPAECRSQARRLELRALRGPSPAPGPAGLRRALFGPNGDVDPGCESFLDRVLGCLSPMLELAEQRSVAVPALVEALLRSAEALAATDASDGAAILWGGEEGNALALHLAALVRSCEGVPDQAPAVLGGLLDASLARIAVRSRRVLRGLAEGAAEHPRLFIWGLLEARLQTAELIVLGGLAETVWPPAVDPGPWMSRPMRARVGLPAPEEAVGQAAHDWLTASCSAPELVLSCPGRRDNAPAVPARWLVRLDAFLSGRGVALPMHPANNWLRRLDQPDGAAVPVRPPAPRPPVRLRPRRLSVTEIETWMRDPYAVHARHVLRLRPLPELEQAADAADYGTVVHEALAAFLGAHPAHWPADAAAGLGRAFDAALDRRGLRPALAAWWRPRLRRIAGWVAREEALRREQGAPTVLRTEIGGTATLEPRSGLPFVLSGRADRIERRADGNLALFDYKTGTLPSERSVQEGWSSQLVLEAAMALRGAFGPELEAPAAEIVYWRLSGGADPGRERRPVADDELRALVDRCWRALGALVAAYDDPDQPYLSHPRPGHAPDYPDYAQLARVAEWSAAREDGA